MTNIEQIIEAVTQVTGVSYAAMQSASRKREIVEARFLCIGIWQDEDPDVKPAEIAPYFRRDRTTIIHAMDTVMDLMINKAFSKKYKECYQHFKSEEQRSLHFDAYSRGVLCFGKYAEKFKSQLI
jgi:chromosomal replication initiation ATPase DnaA